MEHKGLKGLAGKGLDFLLVGGGAKGHNGDHLGLAPGEKGRAVGAGQLSYIDRNGPYLVEGASVDPSALFDHHGADHFLFEVFEHRVDFFLPAFIVGSQFFPDASF